MAKKAKRSERAKDTWNEITGIMSIYGNTFTGRKKKKYVSWSATVGKKNDSGEFDNYYFRVRFAKDANEPQTDGLIVIVEDEVLDDEAPKKSSKKSKDEDEEDEDDEDDLPF